MNIVELPYLPTVGGKLATMVVERAGLMSSAMHEADD